MKHIFPLLLSFLVALTLAACSGQNSPADESEVAPSESSDNANEANDLISEENPEDPSGTESMDGAILIAYFSRSGNTEMVAQTIQEVTGGDLFEIIPAEPYSENYDETVARHLQEQEENARPAVTSSVENMDDYEIVFIGYPIWSSDIPYVVRTFLEEYDFSDKTIVPFCTHGGSRFGNSLNTLEELCPGATILDGYEISGSSAGNSQDEILQWLDTLDIV